MTMSVQRPSTDDDVKRIEAIFLVRHRDELRRRGLSRAALNIVGVMLFLCVWEMLPRVHGEFVNYAAIGIWNRPRQWYRQA